MADLEREQQAYRILQGFVQRDLDRIKKVAPPLPFPKSIREQVSDFTDKLSRQLYRRGNG